MKPRPVDLINQTEKSFQSAIVDLAIIHGWHVHHALPAQIRPGVWRTHVMGNTGFPDLVLAHPKRGVLFVEIKTVRGRLTNGQKSWIDASSGAAGSRARRWCNFSSTRPPVRSRPTS